MNLQNKIVLPLLLTAITCLCLLPFIGKAFHIDDPLFIWCGRQILNNPSDFYGFSLNWDGQEKPMSLVTQNPPLSAYYLALIALIFGWSEIALHAGFLAPALAVVMGTYFLGRRLCDHSVGAAITVITAPVFLVCSTSVMCDTMMTGFWVWSVFFWMEGLRQNSRKHLLAAALLIIACGLTKYFGFCLIPLLFTYSFLERRSLRRWWLYLVLPVIGIVLYQWISHTLYGSGLLFNAASYAVNLRVGGAMGKKFLVALAFAGGCMIVLLAAAPLLWGKTASLVGFVLACLAGIGIAFAQKFGYFSFLQAGDSRYLFLLQFVLFAAAGLTLLILAVTDWLRERNPVSILLLLWVSGTFVFAFAVNWTISGRTILPLIPAAAILFVRRVEFSVGMDEKKFTWKLFLPLTFSLAIALMVAYADFRLAGSACRAARILTQKLTPISRAIRFQGHWGFQYYIQKRGGNALDRSDLKLLSREIIIIPVFNSYLFPLPPSRVERRYIYRFPVFGWATTMNSHCGAGFYSDGWGPLPFVFCPVPPEEYWVYRVK